MLCRGNVSATERVDEGFHIARVSVPIHTQNPVLISVLLDSFKKISKEIVMGSARSLIGIDNSKRQISPKDLADKDLTMLVHNRMDSFEPKWKLGQNGEAPSTTVCKLSSGNGVHLKTNPVSEILWSINLMFKKTSFLETNQIRSAVMNSIE
jgi:hypothetical protein